MTRVVIVGRPEVMMVMMAEVVVIVVAPIVRIIDGVITIHPTPYTAYCIGRTITDIPVPIAPRVASISPR
jgi:hypothetical protein